MQRGKEQLLSVVCMVSWYHIYDSVHRVSVLGKRSNIDEQIDWDPDLWRRYPWIEFGDTRSRQDIAS